MGRTIIADQTIERYLEKLVKENKWFIGVIIGQLTSQRDYVVHLARTPDPVEDEVSEENGDDDIGDSVRNVRQKSNVERPASLDQLDEKWVSTHAKQVSRMLPGGLSVIGLFAMAPPTMLKASQAKLRQVMQAVHRQLVKVSVPTPNQITDRILLQMDTATRKLTCSTLDVADFKSVLHPAEWKFQSGSRWVRLNTTIAMDVPVAVPKDTKAQSLLKQLQNGLSNYFTTVQNSIVSIGGTIRDSSEPLVSSGDKKGKGGKKGGSGEGASPSSSHSYDVNVYLPLPSPEVPSDPVVSESQGSIHIIGTSVVRGFVSSKVTVGEAVQAVKEDIVRSVLARCELLCEEFEVTEENQDRSEVYDPPVRLFCRIPQSTVEVCDYVFKDEKQEEVTQRIEELLDFVVEELEETEKSAADDDTWSQSSASGVASSQSLIAEQTVSPREVPGQGKSYVGALLGGAVAALAAGISYLYMYTDSEDPQT